MGSGSIICAHVLALSNRSCNLSVSKLVFTSSRTERGEVAAMCRNHFETIGSTPGLLLAFGHDRTPLGGLGESDDKGNMSTKIAS